MVGPSSSHTAGAVKIGRVSRKLLAEEVADAKIYFHGSFLATGKGHGTDKAILAGLLGMQVDDPRIPESFTMAKESGMSFTLEGIDLGDVHPNSVKMNLTGKSGRTLEVIAASVGGGTDPDLRAGRADSEFQRGLSDPDRAQHRPARACG